MSEPWKFGRVILAGGRDIPIVMRLDGTGVERYPDAGEVTAAVMALNGTVEEITHLAQERDEAVRERDRLRESVAFWTDEAARYGTEAGAAIRQREEAEASKQAAVDYCVDLYERKLKTAQHDTAQQIAKWMDELTEDSPLPRRDYGCQGERVATVAKMLAAAIRAAGAKP